MRDFTLYKKIVEAVWGPSPPSQYIMVQSIPAATGGRVHLQSKSGSLKQKEKAKMERKQGQGRQCLAIFFQKKGEHSSQLTHQKNS